MSENHNDIVDAISSGELGKALNLANQRIVELEKELERYRKPCEECGGSGWYAPDYPCPACAGLGYRDVVRVPELIARSLFMVTQIMLNTGMPSDLNGVASFKFMYWHITRDPDNPAMWIIEEANKE